MLVENTGVIIMLFQSDEDGAASGEKIKPSTATEAAFLDAHQHSPGHFSSHHALTHAKRKVTGT
jgi:hypothetical protein